MTGIVGRFMSSFGLTSAAAIAVSLIVSFTLTPMLAARWIKRPTRNGEAGPEKWPTGFGHRARAFDARNSMQLRRPTPEIESSRSKDGWFYSKIDGSYTWLLRLAMRFRWAVVLICVVTVASIVPLYKFVGMAFLPDEDESLFQINIRGPQGTSLSATQSILDRIARDVREQIPGVRNTIVLAGGFGGGGGTATTATSTSASCRSRERKQSQARPDQSGTRHRQRNTRSRISGSTVSASSSIAGSIGLGRGGSGIGYYISGPDMEKLNAIRE